MSVSGTPDRPNPPHRMVLPLGISSMAASAEGKTLLISSLVLEDENNRASRSVWEHKISLAALFISREMRGTHFCFWRADDKSGSAKRIHCRNHSLEMQRLLSCKDCGCDGAIVFGRGGEKFKNVVETC